MPFSLNELLKPIEGGAPAGVDLRTEAGLNSLYFKLKDARSQARTSERATEAAGEPVNIPHEWQIVRDLAIEAIATRSKDLEIAAWLLEALLRLEGFTGMQAGFDLIRGLLDTFWPELHSNDEDDVAGMVSPLSGLNGIGGEGALVQPIRMLPLFPDSTYGANALWDWTRVQKNADPGLSRDFDDARAAAGMAAIRERAMEAKAARDAFAQMTEVLDRLSGADAPPSSNIRNALDEVLDAYRILLGGGVDMGPAPAPADVVDATAPAPAADASPEALPAPAPLPAGPRQIATREEAFADLLRIADFFRRNEPHSPISYALETLVWRGRMSFIDLLEELMPNVETRKQLLAHAGIQASAPVKPR